MGLFSKKKKEKKEKAKCPICGSEISFFGGFTVQDGTICEDCEKMVRTQFAVSESSVQRRGTDGLDRSDYRTVVHDSLDEMTVDEIRAIVNQKKEEQAALVQEHGSKYDNIAKVEDCFEIAPSATEVGIKRSRQMKDRLVCIAFIASGEFCRGDDISVTTADGVEETFIIDVYPMTGASTFETELGANMGPHKAEAGTSAWIIVDLLDGIERGDLLHK